MTPENEIEESEPVSVAFQSPVLIARRPVDPEPTSVHELFMLTVCMVVAVSLTSLLLQLTPRNFGEPLISAQSTSKLSQVSIIFPVETEKVNAPLDLRRISPQVHIPE